MVTQKEKTFAWKVYYFSFFLIGVSFLNETGLLYVGTNIFVRNKKNMIYKKIESQKRSTELSVNKIKQAGDKKRTQKQAHKLITTMPPLNFDEMSSNNSKEEQNNTTTLLGRQGYSFEDDYQSRHESSQGKGDHL